MIMQKNLLMPADLRGEFGTALFSHKVEHLKTFLMIPDLFFYTVSGKFIPHEIITIPILSGNVVIAIISLASVKCYDNSQFS